MSNQEILFQEATFDNDTQMKNNVESLLQAEHPMKGKKVTWPRTQLKSHFDSVRELQFCAGG
jgi:hypothetical protein